MTGLRSSTAVIGIPFDVCYIIFPYLSIEDLLRWRATCHAYYGFVTECLYIRRRSLLSPFVENSETFMDAVFNHRALVGGMFALAFLLVDRKVEFRTLDIYVPDLLYSDLVDTIEGLLENTVERLSVFVSNDAWSGCDISGYSRFRLHSGYSIAIYQSTTWSALLPICRSPCTLLFNYVSRSGFGSAYPASTLRGRGLVADLAMIRALPFEFDFMNALIEQRFEISWSPSRLASCALTRRVACKFIDLRFPPLDCPSEKPPGTLTRNTCPAHPLHPSWGVRPRAERHSRLFYPQGYPCFASKYFCPKQDRYFGDAGSLVDFFAPLSNEPEILRQKSTVPYGAAVTWALRSSYSCGLESTCGHVDPTACLLRGDGYIRMPAIPGISTFERTVPRHHPPLYIYHTW